MWSIVQHCAAWNEFEDWNLVLVAGHVLFHFLSFFLWQSYASFYCFCVLYAWTPSVSLTCSRLLTDLNVEELDVCIFVQYGSRVSSCNVSTPWLKTHHSWGNCLLYSQQHVFFVWWLTKIFKGEPDLFLSGFSSFIFNCIFEILIFLLEILSYFSIPSRFLFFAEMLWYVT